MVKIKDKRTKIFSLKTGEGFNPENLELFGAKLVSVGYGYGIEVPSNSVSFEMRYYAGDEEESDYGYVVYYKGPDKARNEISDDWSLLVSDAEFFKFSTNCYWDFWIIDSTD